jgi:MFS family permease
MKNPSVLSVLHERRFVLYLVPWIMFCLVNSLEAPILRGFFGSDFFNFVVVAELAISSISALIGGLVADRMGRKLVAIVGFAMLGVGYAVLGLFPEYGVSRYLYVAVDGIAWGLFVVIFFMVLWGDLAGSMGKDRYYLLGGLPFLLSWLIQLLVEPYAESISIYAAFSLASFFLFLAVLPLLYAPETLPEKRIKDRELKGYVEKAKKAKEKYG